MNTTEEEEARQGTFAAVRAPGVIALDEMRARLVVDLLANNHAEAIDYLKTVKDRIDTLHQLEANG